MTVTSFEAFYEMNIVQTLSEAAGISLQATTLKKSMNLSVLPLTMSK